MDLVIVFIGVLMGIAMGLTGAGGAIIAIPALVHLAGFGLERATVFSLFGLIISGCANWFVQRKNSDFLLAVGISLISFFSATTFVGVKSQSPEWVIRLSFTTVCLISLSLLWRPFKFGKAIKKGKWSALKVVHMILSGLLVGTVTTMTGLGGGVFLIPWLSGPLGLPLQQAVPTSLITICLASTFSVIAQGGIPMQGLSTYSLIGMGVGIILAANVTKWGLDRMPAKTVDRARRWGLTGIILVSLFFMWI